MMIRQFALVLFVVCTGLSSFAENFEVKILNVVGDVQFENAPAKNGDTILKGGLIKVSEKAKSSVDLLYPEGHKIRLKAGAQLLIAGENQNFAKNLTLLKGQSYMHFQKTSDAPEFQIKTKTAVAGVRGTKFLLEEKDGSTYLCVCEGVVELTVGKEARTVSEGLDLWAWTGKSLGKPKKSPGMSQQTTAEFESMKE